MTQLTTELMGIADGKPRKSPWINRLSEVTERLVGVYGRPTLGNFRDPVKEIFYILLSARTTESWYMRAFDTLFTAFPTISDLSDADPDVVMKCIDRAGLGRKRAVQVVGTAKRLIHDFGPKPQSKLRRMSPRECF